MALYGPVTVAVTVPVAVAVTVAVTDVAMSDVAVHVNVLKQLKTA